MIGKRAADGRWHWSTRADSVRNITRGRTGTSAASVVFAAVRYVFGFVCCCSCSSIYIYFVSYCCCFNSVPPLSLSLSYSLLILSHRFHYTHTDMQSFKAANPGCVLADFVRWHSPRDYSESEGLSVRMAQQGSMWLLLWCVDVDVVVVVVVVVVVCWCCCFMKNVFWSV